jgi:hypothetical protein
VGLNNAMFGDGFEQSTILRTGPDGLTRVIERWSKFQREALGFTPSWGTYAC